MPVQGLRASQLIISHPGKLGSEQSTCRPKKKQVVITEPGAIREPWGWTGCDGLVVSGRHDPVAGNDVQMRVEIRMFGRMLDDTALRFLGLFLVL